MLTTIESADPAMDIFAGWRCDRSRCALGGRRHEVTIESNDVDKALEGGWERAESLRSRWLRRVVIDNAALNIQQPLQVRRSPVTIRDVGPEPDQGR